MMIRLSMLLAWLNANGFKREASELLFIKESAGKPLEINRADVDEIVDELIEILGAKLIAHNINPLSLIKRLHSNLKNDPSLMNVEDVSHEDLNKLYPISVERKGKDVSGKKYSAIYSLTFSHAPSSVGKVSPSLNREGVVKKVSLGLGSSPPLALRAYNYIVENYLDIVIDANNKVKGLEHLDRIIRDFLRETLRHEEVHVRDVFSTPDKNKGQYLVKKPSGESIGDIFKKLEQETQIDIGTFLLLNQDKIFKPDLTKITYKNFIDAAIDARKTNFQFSEAKRYFNYILNSILYIKLPKGSRLNVPNIVASEALSYEGPQITTKLNDTLGSVAIKTGINPERLLILNLNEIKKKFMGIDEKSSFEEIYDLPQEAKNNWLNSPLPEGIVLKIMPTYEQLYKNYHDFYLLTREESKAHYEQIIFNIEEAIKELKKKEVDIGSLDMQQMIELSPAAVKYKTRLKPKPVDKVIKTPIGGKTVEQLKQRRYKDFMQRMWHYWSEEIRPKSEGLETTE